MGCFIETILLWDLLKQPCSIILPLHEKNSAIGKSWPQEVTKDLSPFS